MVDRAAAGAIYKGLAHRDRRAAPNFLYATDFHNGVRRRLRRELRQGHAAPGAFTDPNLPAGYAPFGIQAIGNLIYVSYALQDAAAEDDVTGAGLGAVNVFDTAGVLVRRLIAPGGRLNAPWGMAMAPADFGPFSNALLVAQLRRRPDQRVRPGDRQLPRHAVALERLGDHRSTGLWGIAFGNGLNAQPTNTLFFTAGPGDESHGVYGRIDFR